MHSPAMSVGQINRLIPSTAWCLASAHAARTNASPQVSYFVTRVSRSAQPRSTKTGGACVGSTSKQIRVRGAHLPAVATRVATYVPL